MPERKQREFERREQEILDAALTLFDDEQWERVTVAQIAQQAGIGKGTVYKHFSSKEEIYARLIIVEHDQVLDEMAALIARFEDPVELFRALLRYSFDRCMQEQALTRIKLCTAQRSFRERLPAPLCEELDLQDHKFLALVGGPIQQGMESGVFIKRNVNQLITGLHATFDGSLQLIRNKEYLMTYPGDPAESEKAFVADMVEFMLSILTGKVSQN